MYGVCGCVRGRHVRLYSYFQKDITNQHVARCEVPSISKLRFLARASTLQKS